MAITYKLIETDCPDCEDNEYQIFKDGQKVPYAIQDAHLYGGGYGLNQYSYDSEGNLVSMTILSSHRSLKAAKRDIEARLAHG